MIVDVHHVFPVDNTTVLLGHDLSEVKVSADLNVTDTNKNMI